MQFKDIDRALAQWAPPSLAASYDNVGLIVGEPDTECTGILINLDVTEAVIDEAIARGLNLVVTHHPIWFGARKRLNGEDYVSRIILKAARAHVGLLACHTNLDNVRHGVNAEIGRRLGAQNVHILSPKRGQLVKLAVSVPVESAGRVREAIFAAGAGQIGDYSEASFNQEGFSTFTPGPGTNPHIGTVGQREQVAETKIETVLPAYLQGAVAAAIHGSHPYEEPAYDFFALKNKVNSVGSGMIGELAAPMGKQEFLQHVKAAFDCGGIRYADFPGETIQKVAWCGGAGSFLTGSALRAGADAFVTGDITYHKYFDNEDRLLLLDIGHYESEQFTSRLLSDYLKKKFVNFAVHLSDIKTNPVNYF